MRKIGKQHILPALITTTSAMLVGCSHKTPAPVVDLYSSHSNITYNRQIRSNHVPEFYVVKPGDTLFSIAWEHSADYKEMAQINQLKGSLIFPGQKLRLQSMQADGYFDTESLLKALNEEVLNKSFVENPQATNKKVVSLNQSKKHHNKKLKIASIKEKPTPLPSEERRARTTENTSLNWIWPTDGEILAGYSNNVSQNRGLDIAGRKGEPVRASAPGRVVYEGNGLKGYGNLVIIRHDNNYLSAYAHNDKVYVSENEVVTAGQRIADIGSSGTQSEKLHFEIRYKGKPVDPLNYLPDR